MTAPNEHILDTLREHGGIVNANGHKASAQCPAREDRNPSLSVTATEGRTLLHCHAGCPTEAVLAALNLTLRDLYNEPRGDTYATYTYPGGRRVHRKPDKTFPQSGDTKTDCSLYHGDRIGDADTPAAKALGVYRGPEHRSCSRRAGALKQQGRLPVPVARTRAKALAFFDTEKR